MVVLKLLADATAVGLDVRAEGDRLILRGPHHLEPLALKILAAKASVMAALANSKLARAQQIEADVAALGLAGEAEQWSAIDRRAWALSITMIAVEWGVWTGLPVETRQWIAQMQGTADTARRESDS